MSKKYTYNLSVRINIKIQSDLDMENAIDELQTETDYIISSTDNVEVIDTELVGIS